MQAIRRKTHFFVEPYYKSRISLILHLIYMVIYSIILWCDFSSRLIEEEKSVKDSEPLKYWSNSFFLVIFFLTCFCHLLLCMVMKLFTVLIIKSYLGLESILEEEMIRDREFGNEKALKLESRLLEIVDLYEKLRHLAKDLGNAFGIYLLVEMVVMMTSVLMNVFTMLNGFQHRDVYSTFFSFVSYSILLVALTESGEELRLVGHECLEQVKAAVFLGQGQVCQI